MGKENTANGFIQARYTVNTKAWSINSCYRQNFPETFSVAAHFAWAIYVFFKEKFHLTQIRCFIIHLNIKCNLIT